MANVPAVLKTALQHACPPDLDIVFRPMFGGVLADVEGRPFALLGAFGLALKFPEASGIERLAVAGARPLRYAPALRAADPVSARPAGSDQPAPR